MKCYIIGPEVAKKQEQVSALLPKLLRLHRTSLTWNLAEQERSATPQPPFGVDHTKPIKITPRHEGLCGGLIRRLLCYSYCTLLLAISPRQWRPWNQFRVGQLVGVPVNLIIGMCDDGVDAP